VRKSATEAMLIPSAQEFIMFTSDAGATWEQQSLPLNGAFPGIHEGLASAVPTTNGWVMGSTKNRIFVATAYSPAGNDEDIAGVPSGPEAAMIAEPNPMNNRTRLRWNIPAAGNVRLDVFDASGARVATLLSRELAAGPHSVVWNGEDETGRPMPTGNYFARLRTGGGQGTIKLTLIR